jgi:hypothetical protein
MSSRLSLPDQDSMDEIKTVTGYMPEDGSDVLVGHTAQISLAPRFSAQPCLQARMRLPGLQLCATAQA